VISKKWWSVASVGVLALTLAACGSDDDTNGGSSNGGGDQALSGTVRLDGSSTVAPIAEAAAELFMGENSGVQVPVATSGTGGGFEKFCNGETDISNASREIKSEEADLCESNGIAFEQITVGNDALTVVVNKDNPVECLTVEQLNQIWAPGSTVSNWSEIEGLEVDFDEPLELYGPGTDSGTFGYFTEAINGEEGAQRTDYNNIGEDDNTGIIGVEGTLGGMFYVGYTYYAENADRLKALQIDGGNGCVAPSEQAAQDGSYTPLARGLFIYPSDTALARPEVRAFVEFFINNNDQITSAVGAIPLTTEQKQQMLDKVEQLAGAAG
jgi:phosphate transport system substrate-binding protein